MKDQVEEQTSSGQKETKSRARSLVIGSAVAVAAASALLVSAPGAQHCASLAAPALVMA